MDGLSWDRYLTLSRYDRWLMHDELTERIEETNRAAEGSADSGPAGRPKEFRR